MLRDKMKIEAKNASGDELWPELSGWSLNKVFRKTIILQCVATVLILLVMTAVCFVWQPEQISLGALLQATIAGAVLAIIATSLTARSVSRVTVDDAIKNTSAQDGPSSVSLVPVFSGLLNKLLIVSGGIYVGLAVLKLQPIALISTFLFVQALVTLNLLLDNQPKGEC